MKLISFKEQMPEFDKEIILFWKNLNHFENGTVFKTDTHFGHVLFDGEALSSVPTHWAPMPTEDKWEDFEDYSPREKEVVLLKWKFNHCEDGYIFTISTGRAHTLYDGERLSEEPTHWLRINYEF